MPSIITHTCFADELLETVDMNIKEWLEPRKQLFEVGSNGPDFLFYYKAPLSMLKHNEYNKLGNIAHSIKVNEFYSKALECVRNEKDEVVRKDMMAYVCGHLCHWTLDSNVHPYVYYKIGNYTTLSSWWHHRLESLLDAIVLKVKKDCTIKEYDVSKVTDLPLEMTRAVARVYVPIANEVFGVNLRAYQVADCMKDWTKSMHLLADPEGKKTNTLTRLEKLTNKEYMLSGYVIPNTPEDPFDACNLLHNTWHHPCDESIVSTESFFDIYDRCLIQAKNAMYLFLKAVENEEFDQDFLNFIGDRDYNTGMANPPKMNFLDLFIKNVY